MFAKFFQTKSRPELKELFTSTALFSFAIALITIFEPVFFYQEGFSLAQIAFYYGLHYTIYTLLMPLGAKFAARFGLERSLALAMPMFVVYFLTLAAIPALPNLFWIAWVLLALFKIFYYPAFHADFAKFGDNKNRGTEVSWMLFITSGVGVLGPLFGGLIATYAGFPTLFILAAALALLAAIPLLKTKEQYRVSDFSYSEPWKIIVSRQHRRMVLATLGWSEELVDLVFWPIFAFIVLGGVDELGFVASFSILIMVAFGFFVGEMSDRFSGRRVLRLHLPFVVLGYLLRPLALTVGKVLLVSTFARVANTGLKIPFWSRSYRLARHHGSLKYMTAFELTLSMAKAVTAFGLAIAFTMLLPYEAFALAFLVAAGMTLFYLFL